MPFADNVADKPVYLFKVSFLMFVAVDCDSHNTRFIMPFIILLSCLFWKTVLFAGGVLMDLYLEIVDQFVDPFHSFAMLNAHFAAQRVYDLIAITLNRADYP